MKKIVAIFLLFAYGITSIGATIHMHYCMNEFVGWNLWHGDKDNECGKCGMKEKKGGCCKDEHKQIKISDDQQYNQNVAFLFQQFFSTLILSHYSDYNFSQPSVAILLPKNNAPPPEQGTPIYILIRVFRI